MKSSLMVMLSFVFVLGALAVDFPGTPPGPAAVNAEGALCTLSNKVIAVTFRLQSGGLYIDSLENKLTGETFAQSVESPVFKMKTASAGQLTDWRIVSGPTKVNCDVDSDSASEGQHYAGKAIKATFASAIGKVTLNWTAELRDGAGYVRNKVEFKGKNKASDPFTEIELLCELEIGDAGAEKVGSQNGAVVRSGNMFFGVEMPFYWSDLSNSRIRGGVTTTLALDSEDTYSFASVMGVYPEGQLRRAFLHYNNRERARSYKPFLHYNCWFDLERRVSEEGMLDRINHIHNELYTKRGVSLDSYVIDDGYDDHSPETGGFWAYDKNKFPRKFGSVVNRLDKVNSSLGLWISPGGGYNGKDQRFARGQDEFGSTFNAWDLTIDEYYTWWYARHMRHVDDDRANYFKWDQLGSSASGHFMRLMQTARAMRAANPEVFVNTTVGTWPSPFWLNQIDCTWRGGQDMGFEGEGDDREKWLTYRDRVSWDAINTTEHIYPLNALMNHGIVFANGHFFATRAYNGSTELRNEVRSFFGGGYALQELYLTPSLLGDDQWDAIAEGAKWARNKQDILVDAHFIGPSPAQNEVYGFAAWQNNKGAFTLRNPSSETKTYELDIGDAFELPAGAARDYRLNSPYSDQRIQSLTASAGQSLSIKLEPFEVLVFDAAPSAP